MSGPRHGRTGGPSRHHPLVFVSDLDSLDMADDDRHHLGRVLRVSDGESVTAADGAGRWRPARWSGGRLEAAGELCEEPAPSPAITIGFAPTKGDRPAWTVQKLTEIGVDSILLLVAERSVVRWEGERGGRQMDRLTRVAREAAMQSRRSRIPSVEGPLPIAPLVAEGAALAEPGGGAPPSAAHSTVLVGPEGGWTEAELDDAATVGLGEGVLRTETAAVAAAVLLADVRRRGGFG